MTSKPKKKSSKVEKALAYLRDFGRGHISVWDPETLRRSVQVITGYIDLLEKETPEASRRRAAQDAESLALPNYN